jgi:hypothetical protein
MIRRVSIDELVRAGTTLEVAEVLAIARQLISLAERAPHELRAPFGPPCPENVFLDPDGTVVCSGCQTTPTVSELAIFLQGLLPRGTPGLAGSVRYTIARALHEVDAPPFDSLDDFMTALARYEKGDSQAIVRGLLERVVRTEAGAALTVERRRQPPSVAELRRHLRDADVRVYEQQLALDALAAMTAERRRQKPPALMVTVAAAGALVLLGAGEAVHHRAVADPGAPPAIASPKIPTPTALAMPAEAGLVQTAKVANTSRVEVKPSVAPSDAKTVKRTSRDRVASPRTRQPSKHDRRRLNWLRTKLVFRADDL